MFVKHPEGALCKVPLFAREEVERLDVPLLDLPPELFEGQSVEFLLGSPAHSPSIIVEMSVCANSFAMRSTAGFSSLKNDSGSSESWILAFERHARIMVEDFSGPLVSQRHADDDANVPDAGAPLVSRIVPAARKPLMSPVSTASAPSGFVVT